MDKRKCTQCALCPENTPCSCIMFRVSLGFEFLALSSDLTDGKSNIFWFNLSHQQHEKSNDIFLIML